MIYLVYRRCERFGRPLQAIPLAKEPLRAEHLHSSQPTIQSYILNQRNSIQPTIRSYLLNQPTIQSNRHVPINHLDRPSLRFALLQSRHTNKGRHFSFKSVSTLHLRHIRHHVSERQPARHLVPRRTKASLQRFIGFALFRAAATSFVWNSPISMLALGEGRQKLPHFQEVLQNEACELAVARADLIKQAKSETKT